jgi:hypothetical protein
MKLSEKVKNTLKDALKNCRCECKDIDIEDEDELICHYEQIIEQLDLHNLEDDELDELEDLQAKLIDSLDRKYLYLLIEKVKNNLDDEPKALSLGEFIKDKDADYLLENLGKILNDYDLDDLNDARNQETDVRMSYLKDLVEKKHLLLLLEHLESL